MLLSSKTENKVPVKLNIAYGKIDISCKTAKGYVNGDTSKTSTITATYGDTITAYTDKNITETKIALISDIHFNDKYNRKIFTK